MTSVGRIVPILLTLMILGVGARSSQAQHIAKVFRIGLLISTSRSAVSTRIQAFEQGLRERGYIEGQNVLIEPRYADGNFALLPDLAAELVRRNVDVIVTSGTPSTRAAQQATKKIPIVMTVVGTAVGTFVSSLAKPGGNITGLTQMSRDLTGKRLELLKETFPKISRVAHLVSTVGTALEVRQRMKQRQGLADALGLKIVFMEASDPEPDFDGAFRIVAKEHADALMIGPGPLVDSHRERVVELAARTRLPAIYSASDFVEVGGLMSYGAEFSDSYRRAAVFVDRIFKGAKPADLPVEQPTKFELVVNLKTAKAMNLTISPAVFMDADRVIR